MLLPIQIEPVQRKLSKSLFKSSDGVNMAICTPLDNQSIGECFGSRGPIPGRFNCQACCAFREAIFWRNGTHIVECR